MYRPDIGDLSDVVHLCSLLLHRHSVPFVKEHISDRCESAVYVVDLNYQLPYGGPHAADTQEHIELIPLDVHLGKWKFDQ